MHKDITIGDEHDELALKALKDILAAEGAQEVDRGWGVGGSQEIHTWTYQIGNYMLEVTSETYMGLSIGGEAQLVSPIAEEVRQRLSENEIRD